MNGEMDNINRDDLLKEYLSLEEQEKEIFRKKKDLTKKISKFKYGDIVIINNPQSSKYHGKKGFVRGSEIQTYYKEPCVMYQLGRILKDGTVGNQNMGHMIYSFPEDMLESVKEA